MSNPLAYLGSLFTAGSPVELVIKDRDPTQSDRSYTVGQMWFNRKTMNTFIFQGINGRDAVWDVVENPKGNFSAVVGPAVTDDLANGYSVGSTWVDTALNNYYVCVDATIGSAIWTNLSAGGGGGIPAIGASTDRALVLWNGAGGGAVLNSNATLSGGGALTLATPLAVASGGTGANSLTSGGIVLGNGVGAVVTTGQPTDGQLLIGKTGLAPVLASLTAGSNISITPGSGTITIAATGITSGDVVGPASAVANHVVLFDGITGKLIKDSSSVSIDASSNITGVNNLTVGGAFVLSADQVQVSEGGTGATTFTSNGILLGNGTSAISSSAALGNGELLIGSFGNPPAIASLTAGANISITPGAGSITIASTASGGLSYNAVAGTTQTMVENNTYKNANVGLTTFTLPATATEGSRMEIQGFGSGGFVIVQGAGQQILMGVQSTTVGVGGSLASSQRYDNIELSCLVADTTWKVVNSFGNISII